MVKLLMLITSLAGGGAERAVSELSLNFNPEIERKIVTLTDNISYDCNELPVSLGFKIKKLNIVNFVYILFFSCIKYRRLVNKNKADISLSFLVLDNLINVISNIGNKKVKVIVSVHVALSKKFGDSFVSPILYFLIKKIYNKADMVIAVSEGVRNELINDLGIEKSKIIVQYNPINLKKIEFLAKEKIFESDLLEEKVPIIVNVGRLTKPKGQWHLIRSFSKLRKKIKCKLWIIGTGPLESDLLRLVEDFGLTEDVKFLGWKDNPFKYLANASLFVSSSLNEALPYALIEAMGCGCPVISTNCFYGPEEILEDNKYGLLVPSMSSIKSWLDPLTYEEIILYKAMFSLLTNEKLKIKYSKKAKIRALSFDISNIIDGYEILFRKLKNETY